MSGALKAVDKFSGLNTGNYDPNKDDLVHGRTGPKLWFEGRTVKPAMCCERCAFGERHNHAAWCPVLMAETFFDAVDSEARVC